MKAEEKPFRKFEGWYNNESIMPVYAKSAQAMVE